MTVDSGSTKHIVRNGSELHNYRRIHGRVKTTDDRVMAAVATGDRFQTHVGPNGEELRVWLRGCWHIPKAGTNLFSVKAWKAQQQGNAMLFGTGSKPNDLHIESLNYKLPFVEDQKSGQYILDVIDVVKPTAQTTNALASHPPAPGCSWIMVYPWIRIG